MGLISKPFTFSAGVAVSSQVNSDFDTIYNEFNGNIDNLNIKVGAAIDAAKLLDNSIAAAKYGNTSIQDGKIDYTSVKVLRTGVAGLKFARGGKAFNLGGTGTQTITVTFSTDSDDGNPAFGSAPRMVVTLQTTGTNMMTCRISAITNLSATLVILSTSGTDTSTGTVHWMAVA